MRFERGQDPLKALRVGKAGNPHIINMLSEGRLNKNNTFMPHYGRGMPHMFAHAFLKTIEKDPFQKEMILNLVNNDPLKVYFHSGTSNNISIISQFAGDYIEFDGVLYKIPIEYRSPSLLH